MNNKSKEREQAVWNHYLSFLSEATLEQQSAFYPMLVRMKERVAADCSREELRDMMVLLFNPGTVMQGLEQWQCMMDMLLYTGMDKFDGQCRFDHFKKVPPYSDLSQKGKDSPLPLTHIYDLSGVTQDMLHFIFNFAGDTKDNIKLMEMFILSSKLQKNAEIQMLLGDFYRKVGLYDECVKIYQNIRRNGLADDRSIDDAVRQTATLKHYMKMGKWK